MPLELWKSVFEIGGVALLALTFVFGAGALIVNNRLNAIQSKQLDDFKLRFEAERQKTALAQKEAAEAKQLAGGFERDIAVANQKAGEANERAASLEVDALRLRKELVLQGARENLLSGDNRRKLVDALKRFAGQKVDVRYSANAIMVNSAVVSSTPLGDDTVGLANALVGVMKDADWTLPPTALLYSVQGYGINVEIVDKASPSTRAAAEALAQALRDISLVVFGPQLISTDRAQRVGTAAQALSPRLDENTIILGVLTHPK
jgi:hypothetical protein